MTIFLIFLFIGLVVFRVAAAVYADQISFFAALATPLTWICAGEGILMAVFIAIEIYKKLRRKGE